MRTRLLTMLAAILLLASGAYAQDAATEPKLKVGDKAPPLGTGEWVKGDPVDEFESGKVYVIENWATWCGPCIAAIPHVTEIQHKYKDQGLIVIGQNMWESDPSAVEPFVEKMGDKMDYRVVMDEPSGQEGYMAKNWMAAAGRNGIPCAFIVDQKGTIAWIGHPMQMEPVIKKVLAGDYDAKAEAEKEKQFNELGQKLTQAMRDDNKDEALKIADEMSKLRPEMAGQLAMMRFEMLKEEDRWDEAYAAAEKAIPTIEDAQALNTLAWRIVDPEDPYPQQNLEVAKKAADRANELTNGEDAMILDTVARVYWLRGDKKKALEFQQKAVDLNDDPQFDKEMADRLKEYKEGQAEQEEKD